MLLWFLAIVVLVFAALSAYLYFNQKNMVFFPMKELAVTPDQLNLDFDDVAIVVGDGAQVHGWYFAPDSAASKVFLFCHGNAGNISHRMETIEYLLGLGAGILIFDYRSYGKSTGDLSEEGVYADSRACYDWLVSEKGFRADDIIIFGRSLGGAVAIDLASKVTCGALIVESSFTSAAAMARRIFPIMPTGLLIRYKFDSINKIETVKCPILITHSPDDDLIPFYMGEKLYQRAGEPRQLVELSGGHNDRGYLLSPDYIAAFQKLMAVD